MGLCRSMFSYAYMCISVCISMDVRMHMHKRIIVCVHLGVYLHPRLHGSWPVCELSPCSPYICMYPYSRPHILTIQTCIHTEKAYFETYTHAHVHTYIHTFTQANIHAFTQANIHAFTQTNIHAHPCPLRLAGMTYALGRLKRQSIFCISPPRINLAGKVDQVAFDKTGQRTTNPRQRSERRCLLACDCGWQCGWQCEYECECCVGVHLCVWSEVL